MKRSKEFDLGLKDYIEKLKGKIIKTTSDETAFITGIYNAVQERKLEFSTVQVSLLLEWVKVLVISLLDENSIRVLEIHRQEDESWENSFQAVVCMAFLTIVDANLIAIAKQN